MCIRDSTDDTRGFDIAAPNLQNHAILDFWEVKTTVKPGRVIKFYLSRNEFEKSQSIAGWKLVAVQCVGNDPRIIGYLDGENLRSLAPIDLHPNSKWQTLSISFNMEFFREIENSSSVFNS